MMTLASQRVHGAGRRVFHFNPESQVGTGSVPDGESLTGDGLRRTTIPDSSTGTTSTSTTTGSGATPDPETESAATTH